MMVRLARQWRGRGRWLGLFDKLDELRKIGAGGNIKTLARRKPPPVVSLTLLGPYRTSIEFIRDLLGG